MGAVQISESFDTPRLRLRRPEMSDAERIFHRYAQDAEVTKYLTWLPHTDSAEAEALITSCDDNWQSGKSMTWVIEEADSGDLVGMLAARPAGHRVNLGYVIARDRWGRGYMTEALTRLIELLFNQPGVHRIWATCDPDNRGSARVLEKVGMDYEGILRRWDVHPNIHPDPRDALCYAIVRPGT